MDFLSPIPDDFTAIEFAVQDFANRRGRPASAMPARRWNAFGVETLGGAGQPEPLGAELVDSTNDPGLRGFDSPGAALAQWPTFGAGCDSRVFFAPAAPPPPHLATTHITYPP